MMFGGKQFDSLAEAWDYWRGQWFYGIAPNSKVVKVMVAIKFASIYNLCRTY